MKLRKLYINKFTFLLIVLESVAIYSLFLNGAKGFLLFIGLHFATIYFFSKIYRIDNRYVLILSALIPYFPIIFLIKRKRREKKDIEKIDTEQFFILDVRPTKRMLGESTIHKLIEDLNAPEHLRLKAFIIISELITPQTVTLLKKGLTDPSDEIRLLCFSVLNNLEKNIQNEIHKTNSEKNEFLRHKKLAKLHWELIYLNLAEKEFKDIILKQIYEHIQKALNIKNDDELLIFKAKIMVYEKKYEEAFKIFINYTQKIEIVPYLIEIYFYKKNFDKIKELINKYPQLRLYEKFHSIYGLWHG